MEGVTSDGGRVQHIEKLLYADVGKPGHELVMKCILLTYQCASCVEPGLSCNTFLFGYIAKKEKFKQHVKFLAFHVPIIP